MLHQRVLVLYNLDRILSRTITSASARVHDHDTHV